MQDIVCTWDEHAPAFEDHWNAIKASSRFLFKAKHYGDLQRQELKKQNRIAPILLDLWDVVRYIASEIANAEIYLDVTPDVPDDLVAPEPQYNAALGDFAAPDAEPKRDVRWAKWALEHEVFDPLCGYARVRDRVAFKAVGSRAGCCTLEWDPTQGKRGRIYSRYQRSDKVLWHSDYGHPHEPGNPFVMIEDEVDYDWLKNCSGWDNVDKVVPDGGKVPDDAESSRLPGSGLQARKVTIIRAWFLYDTTTKRKLVHAYEPEPLPAGESYMACPECDWESGRASASGLPAAQDCPMCGNSAKPITTTGQLVPTPAYLKGKRYAVVARNSPTAGPLVDGGWVGDPPTFPLMYVVLNTDPDAVAGLSDTEQMSDLQAMKEGVIRMSYEQLQRNRDYLFLRLGAFTDAAGRPARFDGSGDSVAYTENREDLQDINHFQGSGMNQAAPAMLGFIDNAFGKTRGVGQLGVPPEGLKGIQVGVSNRFMESGDVPVERKIDVFRYEESIHFTNHHALQRNLWSRTDWVSYIGDNGDRAFKSMRGEDLPAARVKVTGRPKVDSADMEHSQKLVEMLNNPAVLQSQALLKIVGQQANIPPEWIRDLQKERAQQQAAAARTQAGPAGGPGPGAGTGLPSMNGAGPPADAMAGAGL